METQQTIALSNLTIQHGLEPLPQLICFRVLPDGDIDIPYLVDTNSACAEIEQTKTYLKQVLLFLVISDVEQNLKATK
jgi:hypothetical protein